MIAPRAFVLIIGLACLLDAALVNLGCRMFHRFVG